MTVKRSRSFDTGKPAEVRELTKIIRDAGTRIPKHMRDELQRKVEAGERVEVVIPSFLDPKAIIRERKRRRAISKHSRKANRPAKKKGRR